MMRLSFPLRSGFALLAAVALAGCGNRAGNGAPAFLTQPEVAVLVIVPEPPESDSVALQGDALRARAAQLRPRP